MESSLKKLTKYTNYLLGSLLVLLGAHLVFGNNVTHSTTEGDDLVTDGASVLLPTVYADAPVGDSGSSGDCGDGGGGGDCGS